MSVDGDVMAGRQANGAWKKVVAALRGVGMAVAIMAVRRKGMLSRAGLPPLVVTVAGSIWLAVQGRAADWLLRKMMTEPTPLQATPPSFVS